MVPRMGMVDIEASLVSSPGERKKFTFSGSLARIIQHEIDHLNGTFFFERADLVEKAKVLEKFHQWKRTFKQDGTGLPFGGGRNGK